MPECQARPLLHQSKAHREETLGAGAPGPQRNTMRETRISGVNGTAAGVLENRPLGHCRGSRKAGWAIHNPEQWEAVEWADLGNDLRPVPARSAEGLRVAGGGDVPEACCWGSSADGCSVSNEFVPSRR